MQLIPWGGYPQAERQRIGICRSELPFDSHQVSLAAVQIAGNFLFDPATHRDFLGAMLGLWDRPGENWRYHCLRRTRSAGSRLSPNW